MEQNFNRRIETDLDLNGPHLAISSQPSDASVANGATQTFSVTAAASFPGNTGADDEGYYDVATQTGGSIYSICAQDWGVQMQNLAWVVIYRGTFDLSLNIGGCCWIS